MREVFLKFIRKNLNVILSSIWIRISKSFLCGWIFAACFLIAAFPAAAFTTVGNFDSQCPILLSQAASFAQTCLVSAKPWGREFNGQPEQHVAYVGTPAPGSHFALGCTLDAKHKIAFLGIYYTIHPENFGRFQASPLTYVDYNGDIGILVNGELVNFIAVRPLMPGSISLPRFANGIKNCDPLPAPTSSLTYYNGYVGYFPGPMIGISDVYGIIGSYVKVWNFGPKVMVRYCGAPGACEPDAQYLPLFGRDRSQLLVTLATPDEQVLFIEKSGNLLMKLEILKQSCPVYMAALASKKMLPLDSENMIREVCLSPEYRAMGY